MSDEKDSAGVPGYVSVTQAAKQLDVSEQMVRSLARRGLLQGAINFQGRWLIPSPVVRLKAPMGPTDRPGVELDGVK